ncbi:hypothetical protein ACOJBO_03590 [Rhizobium beringeri]
MSSVSNNYGNKPYGSNDTRADLFEGGVYGQLASGRGLYAGYNADNGFTFGYFTQNANGIGIAAYYSLSVSTSNWTPSPAAGAGVGVPSGIESLVTGAVFRNLDGTYSAQVGTGVTDQLEFGVYGNFRIAAPQPAASLGANFLNSAPYISGSGIPRVELESRADPSKSPICIYCSRDKTKRNGGLPDYAGFDTPKEQMRPEDWSGFRAAAALAAGQISPLSPEARDERAAIVLAADQRSALSLEARDERAATVHSAPVTRVSDPPNIQQQRQEQQSMRSGGGSSRSNIEIAA